MKKTYIKPATLRIATECEQLMAGSEGDKFNSTPVTNPNNPAGETDVTSKVTTELWGTVWDEEEEEDY